MWNIWAILEGRVAWSIQYLAWPAKQTSEKARAKENKEVTKTPPRFPCYNFLKSHLRWGTHYFYFSPSLKIFLLKTFRSNGSPKPTQVPSPSDITENIYFLPQTWPSVPSCSFPLRQMQNSCSYSMGPNSAASQSWPVREREQESRAWPCPGDTSQQNKPPETEVWITLTAHMHISPSLLPLLFIFIPIYSQPC